MKLPVGTAATAIAIGLLNALAIPAQNAIDWQAKAGGKMAFEVASVKPIQGAVVPSNVPLTPWDDDIAANGRFEGDDTLSTYIEFAYKLQPTDLQSREFSRLPKWVATDRYNIEARTPTRNPTKDQLRLMVQSLLAERFQLAVHFEAREVPVFELRLAKAGQPGPKLISHAGGPPCDKPGTSPGDGLPGFACHSVVAFDPDGVRILLGSRDRTMDMLAATVSDLNSVAFGRPVIDKTGLRGRFDFTLEWVREPRGAAAADSAPAPAAPAGPSPTGALRDQLSLKLVAAKDTLSILVIDRVERPSEN